VKKKKAVSGVVEDANVREGEREGREGREGRERELKSSLVVDRHSLLPKPTFSKKAPTHHAKETLFAPTVSSFLGLLRSDNEKARAKKKKKKKKEGDL